MKTKRKKSYADISAQFNRLIGASPERFAQLAKIEMEYRYRILDHFRANSSFTDRMRYTPLARRIYAGY